MQTAVLIAAMLFLSVGIMAPVDAQVKELTVRVDGLACSFCAYGLEKKLKKVEGVEELKIDLDGGKVAVKVKADARLVTTSGAKTERNRGLIAQIQRAVKKGGFTMRRLEVRIKGQMVRQNGRPGVKIPGTGETLALVENRKLTELLKVVPSDGAVTVTGAVEVDVAPPRLSVEAFTAGPPKGEGGERL